MKTSMCVAAGMSMALFAGSALADGKATYDSACGVCHVAGVAGAPKLDDKENWKDRIAQGNDVLLKHVLEGFQGKVGYMPPKGGFMQLSNNEVEQAVDYLLEQSQ